MCRDCERAMEVVVAGKPSCDCKGCMTAGHVLAVERGPGSTVQGLGPWCVSCHHFIMIEPQKG